MKMLHHTRIILAFTLLLLFDAEKIFSQSGKISPNDEAHLMQLLVGYRTAFIRGPVNNSGNGLYAELRLNARKLLNKGPSFSFLTGWVLQDKLRPTGFHEDFVKDYRAALDAADMEQKYIAESYHLFSSTAVGPSPLQPGCASNAFHDYQLYAGFSVQPFQTIPVAIKISGGNLRTSLRYEKDQGLKVFEFRRPFAAIELSWLLNLQALNLKKGNYLSCSVWIQQSNLKKASLYGDAYSCTLPLLTFIDPQFFSKHHREIRAGFSISLAFL